MGVVEDFIETTGRCTSKEQVFETFERIMGGMGYDRVVYSLITDHPRLGKPAGHGIQRNYPDDWMKHYMERGYFHIDPVPKQALKSSLPFTWDRLIEQSSLTDQEMQVMQEAREAKLLDGVGLPIYGIGGEIAGLGLASSTGGIAPDRNMLCTLMLLAHQFHYAYSVEGEKPPVRDPADLLTAKEKEVLYWLAEGKTQEEIGQIMSISANTVKFHTKSIFGKLEVSEKTLAVVKAIRLSIIHPSTLRVL